MKLRTKIIRNSVLFTLAITFSALGASHFIVMRSFSKLQERQSTEYVQRSLDRINRRLRSLAGTAQDYSGRPEIVDIITHGKRPVSISPEALRRLDVDMLVVFNSHRQAVLSAKSKAAPAFDVESFDSILRIVQNHEPAQKTLSGIVSFNSAPTLLVAVPLSIGSRSSSGMLLMTRALPKEALIHQSASALAARIYDLFGQLPQSLSPIVTELRGSKETVTHQNEAGRLSSYSLLDDITRQQRFLLEVSYDRDIWNEGIFVSKILTLSIFTFGLMFCGVEIWGSSKYVIAPVESINNLLLKFSSDKPFAERLLPSGHDEIATLGRSINRMLDEIQSSRDRLLAARERLQYEATHDALTGSWNRAAVMELLDGELARASRESQSVAIIMFDADHFKKINDCYGHSAGDVVLQNITSVISRNLRTFDILSRYGGEEFLVMAPGCTNAEARMMAERILHRLEETSIKVGEEEIYVTMSAGVSSGAAPFSAEELIDAADIALYRAKSKGRNCVECEDVLSEAVPRRKMFIMPRRIM